MRITAGKTVRIGCGLLFGIVLTQHIHPAPVLADMAPPWTAQGAVITPGQELTRVQMVSEAVTLTVESLAPPSPPASARADELMVAHVEATFLMRNQGTETEFFDVWFPLTSIDFNTNAARRTYSGAPHSCCHTHIDVQGHAGTTLADLG